MIYIEEAEALMEKLVKLRSIAKETNASSDLNMLKKHELLCVEKFKYVIDMKVGKYRSFINYEDICQEAQEALLKAMKSYKPKRGNCFWWIHKYVDTRISRAANQHTAIRFPLKVGKELQPQKEIKMPVLIDDSISPEQSIENKQNIWAMQSALKSALTPRQQKIIAMAFGFDGGKPYSLTKISRQFKIPRSDVAIMIDEALDIIREKIKI